MTMYIHTVCISPVFFLITKSRNTFDSPGYCKVQSLAMARTSAPDKFSAPVVHYPETESNKNKQIRQRSVPVIVCEKFKQFHGISNLPWKNCLNVSISSQSMRPCACYFLRNRYFCTSDLSVIAIQLE